MLDAVHNSHMRSLIDVNDSSDSISKARYSSSKKLAPSPNVSGSITTRSRTAARAAAAAAAVGATAPPRTPTKMDIDSPSRSVPSSAASSSSSSSARRSSGALKRTASEANSRSSSPGELSTRANGNYGSHSTKARSPHDDEDEGDHRRRRRRNTRLGGCSSLSELLPERDDSNKENIAPLNYRNVVNESSSQSSAVEIVIPASPARRFPSRAHTMERRSVSSPIISLATNRTAWSTGPFDVRRSVSPSLLHLTEEQSTGLTASPAVVTPEPPKFTDVYAHTRALLRFSSEADTGYDTTAPASATTSQSKDEQQDARDQVEIIGRKRESHMIKTFLSGRFGSNSFAAQSMAQEHESTESGKTVNVKAPSLYICGLPGTGKTALVRSIMVEMATAAPTTGTRKKIPSGPRVAFVNCMSITSPRLIFGRILQQLGESWIDSSDPFNNDAEQKLDEVLKKSKRHILIVLDEIDHLLEKRIHQSVLQRLFSLGDSAAARANKNAKCALIGIANSLDLTERFLPDFEQNADMTPTVLHMPPFSSDEIVKVVQSRLTALQARYDIPADETPTAFENATGEEVVFKKAALELAGRKVAAATGDMRKALDVCRLAVELVETEQREKIERTSADGTITEASLATLSPSSAPKVMPPHILRVMNSVLGSSTIARVRQLTLHAKLLLLAFLVADRRQKESLPPLGQSVDEFINRSNLNGPGTSTSSSSFTGLRYSELESTYIKLLRKDGDFQPLERSELLQVIDRLEVDGIISTSNEVATGNGSGRRTIASKKKTPSNSPRRFGQGLGSSMNLSVSLELDSQDVQDGITTVAPPSAALRANGAGASSASNNATLQVTAEIISRMWNAEITKIVRCRGWEAAAKESEAVRREELGGGRNFQPIGL
ncbi:AAA ATPase [Tilletia horrida]|uniref:AAA ATPase n=1 Tax=Tilletia horrida TaxID=155126 RepID=A0AAN6JT80_9BASI|nr:AAA ATPase [Tilletia horrida]KAK0556389.1 AAA ATPase [Tilletia horrida]KAK0569289.1 AAA ATPase [Tilletia horrida]